MAKAVIQANIQTQNGTVSVAPNAQIEIVDANTLTAVSLWEDRAGTVSKSNPFTADANGFFRVYANSGRVNITATLAGSSQTWNDVILVSEVVGTVSQSGGVPTGAVIERGSNANGEYVKFADGTMICHTSSFIIGPLNSGGTGVYDSPYHTDLATWTYPARFLTGSIPSVSIGLDNNAPTFPIYGRVILIAPFSTTNVAVNQIRAYSLAGYTDSVSDVRAFIVAIGRWY